jgi:hypothetical protein
MPGTVPITGLPAFRPYVYRGTGEDVLTPNLSRGPEPQPFKRTVIDGHCTECGYAVTAPGHLIECGP